MNGFLGDPPRGMKRGDLDAIRHVMMRQYGWIPEQEFYERTSCDDVLRCLAQMQREKDQQDKEMKKLKKR